MKPARDRGPARRAADPDRVRVLGVGFDAVDMAGAVAFVEAAVEGGGPCRVVATANPEFVMLARRDPEFAALLESADLCVADGTGVVWASRRLGRPLPERVAGSDLVPRLAELCARRGWRPFLLGAAPGVAERAAEVLAARYPGFAAAGVHAGAAGPEGDEESLALITAARPELLLVAYGAPRQERWIARNRDRLTCAVAVGVGGSFDFIAGVVPRAPKAWQRVHLEWFWRLLHQPWRARRMAALPRFAALVLAGSE